MLLWASPALNFFTLSPSNTNLCPQSPLALPKLSSNILLTAFSKWFLNRLLAFSDTAPVYLKFVIVFIVIIYMWDQSHLRGLKKMNKSKNIISFQLLCVLGFQNYHFTLKGWNESLGHFDADPESRLHLPSGITVLLYFRDAYASPQSTQMLHGLV